MIVPSLRASRFCSSSFVFVVVVLVVGDHLMLAAGRKGAEEAVCSPDHARGEAGRETLGAADTPRRPQSRCTRVCWERAKSVGLEGESQSGESRRMEVVAVESRVDGFWRVWMKSRQPQVRIWVAHTVLPVASLLLRKAQKELCCCEGWLT